MPNNPDDRAPSKLRIVNYNPSNPIHEGLVSRQESSAGRPVNSQVDATKKRIVMPVSAGMVREPKLSGRHMTNEENASYAVPEEHRVDIAKEAENLPQHLKDIASPPKPEPAPKKKVAAPKKPILQTESQKATSKEELKRRDIERKNAGLAALKKK